MRIHPVEAGTKMTGSKTANATNLRSLVASLVKSLEGLLTRYCHHHWPGKTRSVILAQTNIHRRSSGHPEEFFPSSCPLRSRLEA